MVAAGAAVVAARTTLVAMVAVAVAGAAAVAASAAVVAVVAAGAAVIAVVAAGAAFACRGGRGRGRSGGGGLKKLDRFRFRPQKSSRVAWRPFLGLNLNPWIMSVTRNILECSLFTVTSWIGLSLKLEKRVKHMLE